MPDSHRLGRAAEDRAAEYLQGLGYTLVTRRFRVRHGEIDLVALDGEVLVFVEVKARHAPGYVPEESVGERKLAALRRAAAEYLALIEEPEREVRFDLIAIDGDGMRHYADAFRE